MKRLHIFLLLCTVVSCAHWPELELEEKRCHLIETYCRQLCSKPPAGAIAILGPPTVVNDTLRPSEVNYVWDLRRETNRADGIMTCSRYGCISITESQKVVQGAVVSVLYSYGAGSVAVKEAHVSDGGVYLKCPCGNLGDCKAELEKKRFELTGSFWHTGENSSDFNDDFE